MYDYSLARGKAIQKANKLAEKWGVPYYVIKIGYPQPNVPDEYKVSKAKEKKLSKKQKGEGGSIVDVVECKPYYDHLF